MAKMTAGRGRVMSQPMGNGNVANAFASWLFLGGFSHSSRTATHFSSGHPTTPLTWLTDRLRWQAMPKATNADRIEVKAFYWN